MPTDAEIKLYAETLPAIYRDIMSAFPECEPTRKAGYGLAFQTLTAHFANNLRGHGFDDVRQACMRLADAGFLSIRNGIFAHPTDTGEQLISAVTNKPLAAEARIPELPTPTW